MCWELTRYSERLGRMTLSSVQTTPTVRRRSRLTFGSGRHLTQVKKGGANEPPPYDYSTVHLVGIITNDETGRLVPNPQATRQEPMPLARFKAVARPSHPPNFAVVARAHARLDERSHTQPRAGVRFTPRWT